MTLELLLLLWHSQQCLLYWKTGLLYKVAPARLRLVELVYLHAVRLRYATSSPVFGDKTVLQVNDCLSDLLVFGHHIIVIEGDLQVLLQREGAGQFKHPTKHKRKWEPCFLHKAIIRDIQNYLFGASIYYVACLNLLSKHGLQCAGDVILLIVYRLLPGRNLDVGVTLESRFE